MCKVLRSYLCNIRLSGLSLSQDLRTDDLITGVNSEQLSHTGQQDYAEQISLSHYWCLLELVTVSMTERNWPFIRPNDYDNQLQPITGKCVMCLHKTISNQHPECDIIRSSIVVKTC